MIGWLNLTDEQRQTSIKQATTLSPYIDKAIEKDWWVTLALKALFSTPYAEHLVFKGGTSLSKGYQLINRFSEDIDISLAPKAFDREYKPNPSHSYVKRLKKEGCAFTSTTLKKALEGTLLEMGVKERIFAIVAEEINPTLRDKDPQTLYLQYRSLYPSHPYLKDEVKIEFSVRSLAEPNEERPIQSILNQVFPNKAYEEAPVMIRTTHPRKTFLEKAFLLHEKFWDITQRETKEENINLERGSRHLYDLVKMDDQGFTDQILADPQFYATLLSHRSYWIRQRGIDYTTLRPEAINFVPPRSTITKYKTDYEAMAEGMLTARYLDFETITARLQTINERLRTLRLPQ